MRSIPLALTWELTAHRRWGLVASALATNALFWLIFTILQIDGLDLHDRSMLTMHIVFVQLNAGTVGAAVIAAQGRVSRLFALPAANPTLVAWHLIPAMTLVALELAASIALVNLIFGLDWPIWGPALAAAVAVAAVMAVLWLFNRSAWMIVAFVVVGTVLGTWVTSRYGAMFVQPHRYWTTLTPADVGVMLLMTALAYSAAVFGVSRNRRGDAPFSLGILAWIENVPWRTPPATPAFRGSAHAQFWHEWRSKAWGTPAVVVVALLLMICIWPFASRDPAELMEGFVAGGGGLLSVAGIIGGMILGTYGKKDAIMSQFLATRPLTDAELAKVTLKATALSVITAWAIWAAAFLVGYACLRLLLAVPQLAIPEAIGWWYFPATLAGPWIGATLMATLFMSGRTTPFAAFATGVIFIFIGLMLYSKYGLSREAQERFMQGLTVAAGFTMVAATSWAFVVAWNRDLVSRANVYAAAVIWLALCALPIADCVLKQELIPLNVFAAGLASLAVAPLATAPLAVAWNRHR